MDCGPVMMPARMYGSSYPPSAAELLSMIGGVICMSPFIALVSHGFGSAGVCIVGVLMESLCAAPGLRSARVLGDAFLSCEWLYIECVARCLWYSNGIENVWRFCVALSGSMLSAMKKFVHPPGLSSGRGDMIAILAVCGS